MPAPTLPRRLLLAAPALLAAPPRRAAARPTGQPSGMLARILDTGTLRLGAWLSLPPFGMRSEFGRPDGIDIVLGQHLAAEMGVELRVVALSGRDRLPALAEGRVDMLGTLAVVSQTLLRVAFASPHGEICAVIAARRGSGIAALADLTGRRVAMPSATFVVSAVEDRLPPGVEVVAYEDLQDCLDALIAGEVDAAPAFDWVVTGLLLLDPDLPIEPAFRIGSWRQGFAVRQGEDDLLHLVNTFIALSRANGLVSDVQQRYLGTAAGTCVRR